MDHCLCNDLYPSVFSFLLYKETIPLQKCSHSLLNKKEIMKKYCSHIQPHGKMIEYDTR